MVLLIDVVHLSFDCGVFSFPASESQFATLALVKEALPLTADWTVYALKDPARFGGSPGSGGRETVPSLEDGF